jgi:hypothetical protein
MALRIARGLFRLWLVLSVLWIGGVGIAKWRAFSVDWIAVTQPGMFQYLIPKQNETKPALDPDQYLRDVKEREHRAYIEASWSTSVLALVPPAFLLALGSALAWTFRGFR